MCTFPTKEDFDYGDGRETTTENAARRQTIIVPAPSRPKDVAQESDIDKTKVDEEGTKTENDNTN